MSEELTEQQAEQMVRDLANQKESIQTFFTNVIKADSTTKTGNLSQEELGEPNLPLRSYKELQLFSKEIWGQSEWADYFEKEGEILSSTSLSKDALLLKLAVTTKKELADVTPKERKKNTGWFKKKDKGGE